MRVKPGEREWNCLTLRYRELREDSFTIALRLLLGAEQYRIRTRDRHPSGIRLLAGRIYFAIVEADRQLEKHRYGALATFHQPNYINLSDLPVRGHKVDHRDHAVCGLENCFQNQRIAAIAAANRRYFAPRSD
jgi:hypothetical protein